MIRIIKEEKRIFKITIGKKTLVTDLYYMAKIFKKIKGGYSPIIAICGQQRIGKSLIGVWLCYTFMSMMEKEYKPTERTFYDPLKAIIKLGGDNKVPLLIDEAGDILHKREYYEKIHQSLNKIIQTQAYKTILYVFISPFISDIDKSFIKHFDFIIRVDERGRYKAFEIIKKYDKTEDRKAIKIRFMDDVFIRMGDIPKHIWEEYKEYSIAQKEMMRKELETRERLIEEKKKMEEKNMCDPLYDIIKKYGVKA